MIICNLKGGFGNHLLCFSLAAILSDKYNIKIKLIDNSIKNDPLTQRNCTRTAIHKIVNKKYITDDNINNQSLICIDSPSHYHQVLNNLNINNDYLINIIGNDDLNFYINNVNILKNFLKINNNQTKLYSNTIVVSLRLGMGKNEVAQPSPFANELRLPFEFYQRSIKYLMDNYHDINQLIILSDNYSDIYIEQFFKLNYSLNYNLNIIKFDDKNTIEQFDVITSASYFVLSNSTFSLFGAILNTDAIKIIIPCFKDSGCCFPGSENKRYASILNLDNTTNCMKMLL